MKNLQTVQAVVSVAALLCLATRWVDVFPPNVTEILGGKVFYILVGLSFILQAPIMSNKGYTYAMYAFGAASIVGALMPIDSQLAILKTVGLLGGVMLSLIGRSRTQNNS